MIWRRWLAWYPVEFEGRIVWFRWVERRFKNQDSAFYEYRSVRMHGVVLSNKKTLCGLPSTNEKAGWIFTDEKNMKFSGAQYNLFRDIVTCEGCLEIVKTLRDLSCPECGKE